MERINEYVVDVQGFKASNNEFVFKEVAIVHLEEDAIPSVFFFKPPFKWNKLLPKNKSINHWLELNYHGLAWTSGDISYKELNDIMKLALINAKRVYVKGSEKTKWIRQFVPNQ